MSKSLYQKYHQQITKQLHRSADDDYVKAVTALNLLQSNAQDLKNSQAPEFLRGKLDKIRSFMSLCDVDLSKLEKKLSVIHVTGTKGKGSTCAFCESILRNHGMKTGFFSSPHLVSVRERIRINGQPISRNQFASYFWDMHQKLGIAQMEKNAPNDMPTYFMFLTIMALKIFFEERVDVAILEVGIGGEYDYTNILSNTAVVGISSIGLDHVKILGDTVELIAFQKSGIMKPKCIAIASSDQPRAALKVLQERAVEKKCDFFVAPTFNMYSCPEVDIRLGIDGPAQEYNASLAVQLVSAWMNRLQLQKYAGPTLQISKKVADGLANCRWPGRAQLLNYSHGLAYYLDGAHTLESMHNCVLWYQNKAPVSSASDKKVLVFNMTHSRNPKSMMELLLPLKFDYVIFCPNRISSSNVDLFQDNTYLHFAEDREYEKMQSYQTEWMKLDEQFDENRIKIFLDILSVHEFLERLSSDVKLHVLITGSIHLVGDFLALVDPRICPS